MGKVLSATCMPSVARIGAVVRALRRIVPHAFEIRQRIFRNFDDA
jgi:hypothetical protein